MTRAERAAVLALAGLAALLSVLYQALLLRGGPRIVDAATYLHEASLLARGELSIAAGDVPQTLLGRFLVAREVAGEIRATPIFPPGWPAALAVGVRLGAPFAVGPAIGGLLVLVTAALAAELSRELRAPPGPAALAAATGSCLCAALRYHTADPMAHGWVALLGATALLAAARLARGGAAPWAAVLGLALAWVLASRPVSAAPVLVGCALVLRRAGLRASHLALAAVAAAPPLGLLAAHAHAATGSYVGSAQLLYYSVADGPPGCFRYGFGAGVGCLHEHGDFVRARLAGGFDAPAALGTTARRLWPHLSDVLGAEPWFLLVVAGAARARASPLGRALIVAAVLQPLAYAPFYFDGNYPGGGGRLLADVLPLEHALLGVGVAGAALRRWPDRAARPALLVGVLALLGIAARAAPAHRALRDRDGGAPEATLGALDAAPPGAVVFASGDAGFSIASAAAASRGISVRRARPGALDWMTWRALGEPATFALVGDGVAPVEPPAAPSPTGFALDAADLWPARSQERGYAIPAWGVSACGARRSLALRAVGDAAQVSVWLPSPARLADAIGGRCVRLALVGRWPVGASASLGGDARPLGPGCGAVVVGERPSDEGRPLVLTLSLPGGDAVFDRVEVARCP